MLSAVTSRLVPILLSSAALVFTLLFNPASAQSLESYLAKVERSSKAALLVADPAKPLAIRSDKPLVPASTLKIATALLAIQRWGLEHRFSTEFYRHGDTLWLVGKGDPALTSEELTQVAEQLKQQLNVNSIKAIGLDNRFFPELVLDGRGRSDNPYDAGNAALAVNFNTVNLLRRNGKLQSAEPQTPLTPMARSLGAKVKKKQRLSLPGGRDMSARYTGELFSQLLFARQLPQQLGSLPAGSQLVYVHQSSKTLRDLLIGMLKYSNNFIANQLFLLLPGGEVSIANSQAYAQAQLSQQFGWTNFRIADGAGLSRQNQLTTEQLRDVLESFAPWRTLLPNRGERVWAKTGTLSDNHSYAGYLLRDGQWQPFALLVNKAMPYQFRYRLAEALTP